MTLSHSTKVEVRKALKALDSMYDLLPKISCKDRNAKTRAIAVKAEFQNVEHLQRFALQHGFLTQGD
mgnify:CR=1 FL=1